LRGPTSKEEGEGERKEGKEGGEGKRKEMGGNERDHSPLRKFLPPLLRQQLVAHSYEFDLILQIFMNWIVRKL